MQMNLKVKFKNKIIEKMLFNNQKSNRIFLKNKKLNNN